MAIKYKIAVRCSCGAEHTIEQWQRCPMALTPVQLEPWWRPGLPGWCNQGERGGAAYEGNSPAPIWK